jgi:hypothetical protein
VPERGVKVSAGFADVEELDQLGIYVGVAVRLALDQIVVEVYPLFSQRFEACDLVLYVYIYIYTYNFF